MSFLNSLVVGLIGGLAPIVIIGYGGYEIINDRLTIGSLIAFNSFVGYLFGPTNRLVNVNVQIQKALVALDRTNELFTLPEQECAQNFKLKKISNLKLKNLSFSYNDNKKVIENLNFTINSSEKIGIVGSSGSGKTTLLRIIAGLYEIGEGDFIINDQKLNSSEIVALRKYIAVVEQEPALFDDTIYNNIKFGKADAKKEEILLAVRQAHVAEFVDKLPEKYETLVGNKGSSLSVGQKQRLAIARVLLKKPKILILDEATSSIDSFSEKYISETISNLPREMIVIMVAHRLSTIRNCDKILVMDKGKIAESGTHTELLNKRGLYKSMVNV